MSEVIDLKDFLPNEGEDTMRDFAVACLRAAEEIEFQWGTHMLAKMLVGSAAQRVQDNRLDEARSFGRLDYLPEKTVVRMFNLLLDHGLLKRDHRRTIGLTIPGYDVAEGESDFSPRLQAFFEKAG
ncbi:MAG: RQC domain-containing protein [Myxococcota bacterium]